MGSKTFLFLCFLAVVLMFASEVAARDLASENTNAAEKTNGLEESKYGGGGRGCGPYGCHGGGRGGGCGPYGCRGGGRGGGCGPYGCRGGGRGGGCGPYGCHGGGGGGHCRYGCCGRSYYGGCKCCSYAGQAVDAEPETKPQN